MLSETVDSRTIRMKRKQYDTTGTKTVGTEKKGQPARQPDTHPTQRTGKTHEQNAPHHTHPGRSKAALIRRGTVRPGIWDPIPLTKCLLDCCAVLVQARKQATPPSTVPSDPQGPPSRSGPSLGPPLVVTLQGTGTSAWVQKQVPVPSNSAVWPPKPYLNCRWRICAPKSRQRRVSSCASYPLPDPRATASHSARSAFCAHCSCSIGTPPSFLPALFLDVLSCLVLTSHNSLSLPPPRPFLLQPRRPSGPLLPPASSPCDVWTRRQLHRQACNRRYFSFLYCWSTIYTIESPPVHCTVPGGTPRGTFR